MYGKLIWNYYLFAPLTPGTFAQKYTTCFTLFEKFNKDVFKTNSKGYKSKFIPHIEKFKQKKLNFKTF